MATIKELEKYLNYEFSSGPYTGEDYKNFQNKYINHLRSICREYNWELVNIGKNHYCFSAFIRNQENKYVYISISDVRFFSNEWYYHILYRTAAHEKDYRGGCNQYTNLQGLQYNIQNLFLRT
ncbi:MAG: hypothetical protein E7347_04810 [Clostridiales bacterium]|nr:hypothetical protein [Clostridiales bacterium]